MKDLQMAPPQPCACQSQPKPPATERSLAVWLLFLAVGIAAWFLIYFQLDRAALWVTTGLLGLDTGTHLGEAVRFFVYDTPKVLMLLVLIVFFVGVLRSFFTPATTRRLLAGRR